MIAFFVLCEAITSKIPCLISKWCNISWLKWFVEIFNDKKDFEDKLNTLIRNNKKIDQIYYESFNIEYTINKLNELILSEIK